MALTHIDTAEWERESELLRDDPKIIIELWKYIYPEWQNPLAKINDYYVATFEVQLSSFDSNLNLNNFAVHLNRLYLSNWKLLL